jgi:hypothetical protein
MEEILRSVFPDVQSMDDVTIEMFHKVMMVHGHALKDKLPKDWTFGGLQRGPDGRFKDAELAELIKCCTEEPAHAFGAHGTPASLKVVDLMGQLQAREMFNVCTLNEFRRYLNLKPYETFEDWCSDKETARAAELLYGHIENMELYPGLMAECTKPAMPGSGVCPGQVSLTRSFFALLLHGDLHNDSCVSPIYIANRLTDYRPRYPRRRCCTCARRSILELRLQQQYTNAVGCGFTVRDGPWLLRWSVPEAAISRSSWWLYRYVTVCASAILYPRGSQRYPQGQRYAR